MKIEIYTSNTLRGDVTLALLKFDAGGNLKFCTDVHQRKTKQSRWPDACAASSVGPLKAASWQKNWSSQSLKIMRVPRPSLA